MKNNLVFKFIAVILCAASLMGAIGGVTGVVVLASGDLYNKTVEQVQQENTAIFVESKAKALALQYSSSTLGGCPENMVTNLHGIGSHFAFDNYGYRILDAEGNVLSAYNEGLQETATLFTLNPKGQYMHLVDMESETEKMAREQEELAAAQAEMQASYNSNEIPDVGIAITQVILYGEDMQPVYVADYYDSELHITYLNRDSSGYTEYSHFEAAGYLIVNQKGELVYTSYADEDFDALPVSSIHAADFSNDRETFYYSIGYSQDPIGRMSRNSSGRTLFQTFADEPAVVAIDGTPMLMETVDPEEPVVTLEIVPIGETVPAVTEIAVEATAAEETMEATMETVDVTAPTTMEESVPTETAAEAIPAAAEATETTVETTAPAMTEETVETTEAAEATEETEATETVEATEPPTEPTVPETIPEETVPAETEAVMINGKALDSYQINTETYWDHEVQEWMTAKYVYVPMPELTVELYVDESSYHDADLFAVVKLVRDLRGYLLPLIGISLLVFAVFTVYLCTAAGRKPGTQEVRAGGLNRIPLDLYFLCGGFAIALIAAMGVEGAYLLLQRDINLACALAVAAAFAACLVFVGFCYALVAQIKTPGGFWYRNTLCGHTLRLSYRFMLWLERFLRGSGFPFVGRCLKGTWQFTCKACVWCFRTTERVLNWIFGKLGAVLRWMGRKLNRFFSLLPLMWQWLLAGFFVVIVLLLGIDSFKDGHNDFGLPLALMITFAVLFYVAHCFGILSESTKKMSKGDLTTKVDDKLMIGCFREFAEDLNDLADVAVVAAQKQLKSERMKTELITNVSHDIKTPLTSIINYVDLLQKPHSPEEAEQYLEVLERQSLRLKKLIDDLMDMSKANTGNMQVDITTVDAVESVNQALGEFSDKLDKAMLLPVFRHEEDRIPMQADGRLVWRVLSNLLSNAVKYAMPGTRLYIDLMTLEGKVVLSLKNISREELNIDADELMERFVRGDDSRNTEGSGLGLNIAKSLMELQKGQLQLLVDGDLFKVTLIFPGE